MTTLTLIIAATGAGGYACDVAQLSTPDSQFIMIGFGSPQASPEEALAQGTQWVLDNHKDILSGRILESVLAFHQEQKTI